jgi:hypothetical protein
MTKWLKRYVWYHRWHKHSVVANVPGGFLGLPITVCWTCDMSWEPVWGTGDTIVRQHPKEDGHVPG